MFSSKPIKRRLGVYRVVLDVVQPHKGSTTDVSGQIPAELKPFYTRAVTDVNQYAEENPLGQFGASNPEQVAPLSYQERLAQGQIPGLLQQNPLNALALQAILRQPTYAGAGPTTGSADFSDEPRLADLYGFMGGPGGNPTPFDDPNVTPGGGAPPGPPGIPPTVPPIVPPIVPPTTTPPGAPPPYVPPPGGNPGGSGTRPPPRVVPPRK